MAYVWKCANLNVRCMHPRAVESQRFSGGFGVTFIWNILSTAAHSLPYRQGLEDGGAAASMPRFYCRVGWRIKIDWVCSKDDKSLEDTIVGVGGCDYLQWGILSYLNKNKVCVEFATRSAESPLYPVLGFCHAKDTFAFHSFVHLRSQTVYCTDFCKPLQLPHHLKIHP